MQMAATKPWTLDELDRLPEDSNTYELVHGELFVTPAPSHDHQTIAALLTAVLAPYVKSNSLGLVHHPRSVIQLADTQVEPDIMVRADAPRATPWNRAPLPILVVEIPSPTTRRRDYAEKRALYTELQIPEYWIVDSERRLVTVVRPGQTDVVRDTSLEWHPSGAAAPLTIELRVLFD
jgi:Uma2 family endonuclease